MSLMPLVILTYRALTATSMVGAETVLENLLFKESILKLSPLSKEQTREYAKNETFEPRIDFAPTGSEMPADSAGVSYAKHSKMIIGGTPAAPKQFPWQVVLNVDDSWLCGGSLLSSQWVLTAAHCVDGGSVFQVSAGGIDRLRSEFAEQTLTSSVAIVHEDYDNFWLTSDIALIKFHHEFYASHFINPIRLPRESDAKNTFVGSSVIATGYGLVANNGQPSRLLNFISLQVTSNANCASFFGTNTVVSSCICTAADRRKSICDGDSGGPLVIREADGLFTQIGIVSFGAMASCNKYPSGYTRVTSFLGWISSKTGLKIAK